MRSSIYPGAIPLPEGDTVNAAATASDDRASLTIDMGVVRRISGFAYLPRQDWNFQGVIDRYRFATSLDDSHSTTQETDGAFGNIQNNPVLQEVRFAPAEARYFRFTALRDVQQSGLVHLAEITGLPVKGAALAHD